VVSAGVTSRLGNKGQGSQRVGSKPEAGFTRPAPARASGDRHGAHRPAPSASSRVCQPLDGRLLAGTARARAPLIPGLRRWRARPGWTCLNYGRLPIDWPTPPWLVRRWHAKETHLRHCGGLSIRRSNPSCNAHLWLGF